MPSTRAFPTPSRIFGQPASRQPFRKGLLLLGAMIATLAPRAVAAPTITKFPNSQTVAVGQAVTLTVEATGTAPLTYQWYRGTDPIAGATAATYSIASAQLADAGIYAIAVTDSTGTVRSFSGFGPAFAGGTFHTLFTKTNGALWVAGNNNAGQLGNGTTTNRSIPDSIATDVTAVATGGSHSLFVKTDGSLWAMGSNLYGQLGDGTITNRSMPVQIAAAGVAAIATGSDHSVFLKTDGTLWAMGQNNWGQLGDGLGSSRTTPVQIASGVQSIAASTGQTFFVKTDGTLWGCGNNSSGQLGDGTTTHRSVPAQIATDVARVRAGPTHTLFVKTDGTAWGMGSGSNGQLGGSNLTTRLSPVQILTGVQAVAAGNLFSFFLKTDATLWGSGYNGYGQFGDGTSIQRFSPGQVASGVAAVAAGDSYALVLKTDGSLWASGNNTYGQLADGFTGSRNILLPVLVPTDTPVVLNVGIPPAITTQPVSQAVTAATNATLSVTASGVAPLFYQWYRDGVAVPFATGSTISIGTFNLDRVGAYTVVVTNTYGTVTSAPAGLTLDLPILTPQVAVTGKAVSFAATHGNAGLVSWQISTDGGVTWTNLSNNETYAGTDSLALRIPNVTRSMASHLFRYQVASQTRVATSGPIGINVIASPLELPTALALDRTTGNLYITDAVAQTVLRLAPDLKLSVVAGKTGETGSANGPALSARFFEPSGLMLAGDGSIILADTSNSSIRQIIADGAVTTYAGQSGSPGSTDGNTGTARFNAPVGVTGDLSGNVIVTDQGDHTVRLIAGGLVQTVAGRALIPGVADGQGTAASFNQPTGVAVRRDNFTSISWGGGNNGYGTTFVADQGGHTIRTITTTGLVGTYAGLGGSPGFANGNRISARFRQPAGLAFDGDGSLYVADTGNHVIRRIDVFGNVSTLAGTPGVGGLMDGTAAQSQFLYPEGVAVDGSKNVYVADTGNGVIRLITPAGKVSTLLILGNVPTITTPPASLTVTAGMNASFSVAASGEGTLSYQWKKDGTMIAGATSATYTLSSVATANAGSYTVSVSNNWGASESSAATLTVNAAPPPPTGGGGGGGGGSGGGAGGGGAPSLPFLLVLGASASLRLLRRNRLGRPNQTINGPAVTR